MTGEPEGFDSIAERFYDETHVMAPGKDVAAAMGGYDESLLRSKLFQMWKQRVELERKLREALTSNRLGWQEVEVIKAELAAVEQAVRNVAPIENNESWISPDDAPPSPEDMKRYVVFNDDADPIVDAATLSEAVKQIINCWTNVSEAADVAMGRVEMYEKALESVGIAPCHEDKPMTWVRITENGETGYDSLQQIIDQLLNEAIVRIARLEKEKLGALFAETVYKVALGTVSRAHAMMSVHDLAKRYGIPNPLATDTTPGIV